MRPFGRDIQCRHHRPNRTENSRFETARSRRMWTHWAYKNDVPADLEQGDVLTPTEPVKALLGQFHPYYAGHEENRFYVVLTQSCDLVRRNGACKAEYVAIAPVRTLRYVVHHNFATRLHTIDSVPKFSSQSVRGEVERFLERLFNNNEPSYFFLDAEPTAGITEPMCCLLRLAISLRTDHYAELFGARIIGIDDVFQAKLGWLLGQLFSRVGTRDFPESEVRERIRGISEGLAVWFDDQTVEPLLKLIQEHKTANPDSSLTRKDLERLIGRMPKRKALIINRVLDLASEAGFFPTPSPQRFAFRKTLERDENLAALFK